MQGVLTYEPVAMVRNKSILPLKNGEMDDGTLKVIFPFAAIQSNLFVPQESAKVLL